MKKNNIIICIISLLIFLLIVLTIFLLNNKKINYDNYKGYWYVDKSSFDSYSEVGIGIDLVSIKTVDKTNITFDIIFAGLFGENNITTELKNGVGEIKTNDSTGTIELKDNKIIISIKNKNYDSKFDKTFSYKSSEKKTINSNQNVIGEWTIEKIIDLTTGEERGNSQHYGMNISTNYHFEFYADGTYIKQLGEENDNGTYEIVGNKINMTSKINNVIKTLEISSNTLIEDDGTTRVTFIKK